MSLPAPRGPLSQTLLDVLTGGAAVTALTAAADSVDVDRPAAHVLGGDDLPLALYLVDGLHYGGLGGVGRRGGGGPP
ncbi:MAG: hypothetical protein H7231_04495, partial [Rhodoferax sp.]|nr:hypothetical protein [Actinomycetota bacterium]